MKQEKEKFRSVYCPKCDERLSNEIGITREGWRILMVTANNCEHEEELQFENK